MEPSDISLKIAELILQTKRADLWGDVLKIGIPSLITLISLVITYLITLKNNAKDIAINQLKINSDSKKEIVNREVELIKGISIDLTKVHDASSQYTSMFAAKLDILKSGLPFPKENQDKLSDLYEAYVKSLHENLVIESSILLLGNQEIIDNFRKYNSLLSGICTAYAPPNIQINYKELLDEVHKLNLQKEVLFRLISKRHFAGYA